MQIIEAPTSLKPLSTSKAIKVFIAGSIELGKAKDWQIEFIEKLNKRASLKSMDIVLFNPRRKDWDCVDKNTLAIMEDGIKSYDNIKEGDLILTYNIEKDKLEYKPILKLNKYKLDSQPLLEFKRNNDKFYFTKNHMFLDRRTSTKISVSKKKAETFINKDESCRTPAGKILLSEKENNTFFGEHDFLDEHFKLAAWILSEGWIFKRKDCNVWQIGIAQSRKNSQKVKEIQIILSTLNIKYRYDGKMEFYLDNDGVNFVLGILGIQKSKIPYWIKNANTRQKKIFITEYAKGDGCVVDGSTKFIYFSSKYQKFIEEFQILCYEAGICSKRIDKTSGFGFPVVSLSVQRIGKKWYSFKYNNTLSYGDIVWCPTTENETWVAYRNGTPFITGNSSWKQDIKNLQFREQVEWELEAQKMANVIPMHFESDALAPITLMEFGLNILFRCTAIQIDGWGFVPKSPPRLIVHCPKGFWRKGNVDIVCAKYNIKQVETLDDLVAETVEFIQVLSKQKKL